MKAENITFVEAVEELGSRVGIAVEKPSSVGISKSDKDKIYDVINLATRFFAQKLQDDGGQPAREYLDQRGINQESARYFNLGFAPEGWDNLFKYLISRGVSPALIEQAGLTLPREGKDGYYDRFRHRLIFPIFDPRGRPVAFSGRSLKDEEPKYLNSPDTPIFRKGDSIFGLNFSKESMKEEKKAILVEGNLDLVTAFQAGIKNVAAPLGTALTVAQCKLLSRFADTIVLAFDADPAGNTAAERSIELLRSQGLKVKVAELKGAKDPDELIRRAGANAFQAVIDSALPFLEFKINRALARYDLSEIESRSKALRNVAQILQTESDQFVQQEYARLAAAKLKIDAEAIMAEVKRLSFYHSGTARDLRRTTEKPTTKIAEAEKILLGLAVEKKEFLAALKKEVKLEDFISAETKSLAKFIFSTDFNEVENIAHYLVENLPQEEDKQFLAKILVSENPENPATVFDDCLRVMKEDKVKIRIEAIMQALREAEKAGETQKAAELIAALKSEIH